LVPRCVPLVEERHRLAARFHEEESGVELVVEVVVWPARSSQVRLRLGKGFSRPPLPLALDSDAHDLEIIRKYEPY
jgi:hypothetical protein